MRVLRRRTVMSLILWAALSAAQPAADPAMATIDDLAWLAGRWRTESGPMRAGGARWTEEIWTDGATGAMLGISRSQQGFGRFSFEFMRIAPGEGGRLAFHGSPEGAPAVAFPLASVDAMSVTFENPGHDYPQRIVYRREGDRLVATISMADGSRPVSWTFARQPAR
jgi:hypothetical protein